MERNLSARERVFRSVCGLALVGVVAWQYPGTGLTPVLAFAALAGAGLLVSGATGYCGVYALFGVGTAGSEKDGC
mgnify:CR=1 FL=1